MSIDLHGRRGIGVVQPEAGADFPLLQPSSDVRHLLADLHIAFDQPSDYADVPAFVPPFRVQWLSGFGDLPPSGDIPTQNPDHTWNSICQSESLSSESVHVVDCLPLPRHDHDIIIVDSQDQVVFDSTGTDIVYAARDWNNRLRVVTWRHPTNQYVNLVYHTAWNADNDPEPQEYSSYFFPTAAVIDERAIEQLPLRVRSLTVVLDNIRETGVEFLAGYNMQLAVNDTVEDDGKRRVTRVIFDASAGGGLGVYPDCNPGTLQITTINGVTPTDTGDFFLSAADCYWLRQPMRIIDTGDFSAMPECTLTPGSLLTAGMPAANAGRSKSAAGWPINDDPRYAQLQIGNDCTACCDCPDYVAAAQYMNAVRDQYQAIGVKIEAARDKYSDNRDRWLEAAACVNRRPLRLRMAPQACPFLDVVMQLCNHGTECLTGVEAKVTMSTTPTGGIGVEVPGYTYITGASTRPGTSIPVTEKYGMGGTWPTFTAFFDAVQPGQSVNAKFRLRFDDCGMDGTVPYAITGLLTATVNGTSLKVTSAADPDVLIQATSTDTQTLSCPAEPTPIEYIACQ